MYDLNHVGFFIFASFIGVGIAIGLYLMFGKEYDRKDEHPR